MDIQTRDLVMIMRRMIVRLNRHRDNPEDMKLAELALSYLFRSNLVSGADVLRGLDQPSPEVREST